MMLQRKQATKQRAFDFMANAFEFMADKRSIPLSFYFAWCKTEIFGERGGKVRRVAKTNLVSNFGNIAKIVFQQFHGALQPDCTDQFSRFLVDSSFQFPSEDNSRFKNLIA